MGEHIKKDSIVIKKNNKKIFLHFICLLLLIVIDQLTKLWVRNQVRLKDIALIPKVLKFTFVKNTGAVFGLFSNQVIPLTILSIGILIIVLWFYMKIPDTKRFVPLTIIIIFITAGALGNIIDRIILGYVTDFIYIELIDFFVFNVADMYLTVSAFILVILSIFYYKDDEIECLISKKNKNKIVEK